MLSRSVAFEHDSDEVKIWLNALPALRRSKSAKAPDETPLTDELSAIISFVDECLLRCLKTPYHYLEGVLDLCYGSARGSSSQHAEFEEGAARSPYFAPSPLLATAFEQFSAKRSKGLISASDTLALITYLRRVLTCLVGKQPENAAGVRLLEAFKSIVQGLTFSSNETSIQIAVARELRLLSRAFYTYSNDESVVPLARYPYIADETVNALLTALEDSSPCAHILCVVLCNAERTSPR